MAISNHTPLAITPRPTLNHTTSHRHRLHQQSIATSIGINRVELISVITRNATPTDHYHASPPPSQSHFATSIGNRIHRHIYQRWTGRSFLPLFGNRQRPSLVIISLHPPRSHHHNHATQHHLTIVLLFGRLR